MFRSLDSKDLVGASGAKLFCSDGTGPRALPPGRHRRENKAMRPGARTTPTPRVVMRGGDPRQISLVATRHCEVDVIYVQGVHASFEQACWGVGTAAHRYEGGG